MILTIAKHRRSRARHKGDTATMMLTSLMDIFIVLVLYLLVNQSSGIVLETPDHVVLPDSGVDTLPRQSVLIVLSEQEVRIQGQPVVAMSEVLTSNEQEIAPIREAIDRIKADAQNDPAHAGLRTEVTIVADRGVRFSLLNKVMRSCANAGYGKISFAVNQK